MKVFITGGTTGLGRELSRRFLRDGCTVGVCSFEPVEEVQERLPGGVHYYRADVRDHKALGEVVSRFAKKFGGLDVMVANAGVNLDKARIPDFDRARQVIDVNVKGVLNTFEAAIPIMKEQGSGQIVALASVAGYFGLPGTAVYGASKAAVKNLCESFHADLSHYGIQVTTIAPGFIATPLTEKNAHSMPFLMTQEKAGRKIYKAIRKRKGLSMFPLPIAIGATILYHLPRSWYRLLMRKDPMGLSK